MDQQPTNTPTESAPQVLHFGIERQWGQLIGSNIRTFDQSHNLVCFAKQKAFKLREEITFFHDEAQTQPMFSVKARNIIDIGATYDMFDQSGNRIGALRRKGLASSFIQDKWMILNGQDEEVGSVIEDSTLLALLRRYVDFVAYFIPQTYNMTLSGVSVGTIRQRKNPFTVKYDYDIQSETYAAYTIICIAIPNLLAIIEARQN